MKKFLSILFCLMIMINLISLNVSAQNLAVSVSGTNTIRAGDTLTLTYRISGAQDISYISLDLAYNTNHLTYVDSSVVVSQWRLFINEDAQGKIRIIVSDEEDVNPVNGSSDFVVVRFNVRSNVSSATNISVAATDILASNIGGTNELANVNFTRTVSPPLSSDNNLSALSVSNASITPAFSSGITTYSATVPFSVSSLNINATTSDSRASTSISGNTLRVGSNAVLITVTAENGARRTYTINVTREQDPNYVASNNAKLKSIIPNNGILSPFFEPERTLYHIYLPFEIESFDATGEAQDAKAQGVEKSPISLNIGENEFTIKGIAEDGTEKIYTIMVFRMPAVGEAMPEPTSSPIPTDDPDESWQNYSFKITGSIVDSENNPLKNKILELHSDPMITSTDELGNYKFDNVKPGEHTLYIKESDGTDIATMTFILKYGESTRVNNEEIIVSGDAVIDLVVSGTEIQIKRVAEFGKSPQLPVNESQGGIPWWGVLLIAIFSAGLGFLISRLLPVPGRDYDYEERDEIIHM